MPWRSRAIAATAIAGMSLMGATAPVASADTVVAQPGKYKISAAIDRASPGDRILVKCGLHRDSPYVEKRVRIVGEHCPGHPARPVVTAGCGSLSTVSIQTNGVGVRGLRLRGAMGEDGPGDPGATVDVGQDIRRARLANLRIEQTCHEFPALYGISLWETGSAQVLGNRISGVSRRFGAAIDVIGVAETADSGLLIEGNRAERTSSGLSLRSVGPAARVIVRRNHFRNLRTGINAYGASGVRFARNRSTHNREYGFQVSDVSENNVFVDNVARRNRGANFLNEGSGNCGSGNTFPIAPC